MYLLPPHMIWLGTWPRDQLASRFVGLDEAGADHPAPVQQEQAVIQGEAPDAGEVLRLVEGEAGDGAGRAGERMEALERRADVAGRRPEGGIVPAELSTGANATEKGGVWRKVFETVASGGGKGSVEDGSEGGRKDSADRAEHASEGGEGEDAVDRSIHQSFSRDEQFKKEMQSLLSSQEMGQSTTAAVKPRKSTDEDPAPGPPPLSAQVGGAAQSSKAVSISGAAPRPLGIPPADPLRTSSAGISPATSSQGERKNSLGGPARRRSSAGLPQSAPAPHPPSSAPPPSNHQLQIPTGPFGGGDQRSAVRLTSPRRSPLRGSLRDRHQSAQSPGRADAHRHPSRLNSARGRDPSNPPRSPLSRPRGLSPGAPQNRLSGSSGGSRHRSSSSRRASLLPPPASTMVTNPDGSTCSLADAFEIFEYPYSSGSRIGGKENRQNALVILWGPEDIPRDGWKQVEDLIRTCLPEVIWRRLLDFSRQEDVCAGLEAWKKAIHRFQQETIEVRLLGKGVGELLDLLVIVYNGNAIENLIGGPSGQVDRC